MPKKIVITGATGLIGTHIFNALIKRGDEITVFTRSPEKTRSKLPGAKDYINWTAEETGAWAEYLNDKDAVIHLAGASLAGKRWTDNYKREILRSREISTKGLVRAIGRSSQKPEVFVCASAIGYYGSSDYKEFTEDDPPGNDFTAEVCTIWESEAAKVESYGVRRVSIRTGIVLDKNEGALAKMLLPFRFFAGGPLGNGTQWMSWIHVDDITSIYLLALDNPKITGPVNASSPNHVTMNEFSHTLGEVLNQPSWIKVPEFILKVVLGEMSDTVLKGQKVIPKKLSRVGYSFKYPVLEGALNNLLS